MVEPYPRDRDRDHHHSQLASDPTTPFTPIAPTPNPQQSPPPASHQTWPGMQGARPEPDGRLRTIAPPIHQQSFTRKSRAGTILRRLVLMIATLIPLTILLTMASVYWGAHNDQARKVDAIVIMGAAQYNGVPSEVLEARIAHAFALWNEGLASHIVVTGGKMPGDAYTEAQTEATWLVDRGVPESAIIYENAGRDTWQSMQGVAAALKGTDVHSLLIVSDGFHLTRSKLMATELGFKAYGSPVPDSPIRPWSGTEFSYVIRETGGILAFLPTFILG